MSDAIEELGRLLQSIGAKVTLDRHRNITLGCCLCETVTEPRDLVRIGTYTRIMGGGNGPGDPIIRPMCNRCRILTEPEPTMMSVEETHELHKICKRFHNAHNDDAEQAAKRAFALKVPKVVLETLCKIVENGPVADGDMPSIEARGHLILWGICVRVLVKGEQGFTAATYDAGHLLTAVEEYAKEKMPQVRR